MNNPEEVARWRALLDAHPEPGGINEALADLAESGACESEQEDAAQWMDGESKRRFFAAHPLAGETS